MYAFVYDATFSKNTITTAEEIRYMIKVLQKLHLLSHRS